MKTLDDIIPPSKRTHPPAPPSSSLPPSPPPRTRSRGRFPLGTLIVVLFIIAVSGGALFYFSNAEVRITPLARSATVTDLELTAESSGGDLSFEVLTVQKVASQSVESSGSRAVSSSAEGELTIYNAEPTNQRLIANTRFQTTSGLVFRIKDAVTVPAADGGTPGTLRVTVYADKPGSEYNVGPTSFTLPGLSGSSLFTSITAKSTTAMSGGASGNEPTVASETESATRAALQNALTGELQKQLEGLIPEGYILVSGASETSFAPLPTTESANAGMADIKQQGTMRAVVFPSAGLAREIAVADLGANYTGEPVMLGQSGALVLNPEGALPAEGDESFAFTLSGTASIISTVDAGRISAAVAGKSKDEADSILRQYPEVAHAVLLLRPFWRTSFPEDPSQITIEVLAPAGN